MKLYLKYGYSYSLKVFSCHTVIALIFVDVSRVSRLSWGTSFMKILFSLNGFVCFLALLFSSLLE